MPHVVLEGNLNLKDLIRNFKRVSVRIDDAIIKLDELFINAAENRLLAKAVVVESSKPRSFYLDIMLKGSSITVRLDDLTMPEEKSDGVKLSIALMANLLKKYGDLSISKTNIVDQLSEIDAIKSLQQ
ncbi:MAG: hypothetical protein ACK4FV_02035 [Candidatus Nitrosocaldus sp.]